MEECKFESKGGKTALDAEFEDVLDDFEQIGAGIKNIDQPLKSSDDGIVRSTST